LAIDLAQWLGFGEGEGRHDHRATTSDDAQQSAYYGFGAALDMAETTERGVNLQAHAWPYSDPAQTAFDHILIDHVPTLA
jgi:hypothetical protein